MHRASVDLEITDEGVEIEATVGTADRTGVEMEALTSVSVAALAIVDMVKGMDKGTVHRERAHRVEDRRQVRRLGTGRR